jgi:hypothetical protein
MHGITLIEITLYGMYPILKFTCGYCCIENGRSYLFKKVINILKELHLVWYLPSLTSVHNIVIIQSALYPIAHLFQSERI